MNRTPYIFWIVDWSERNHSNTIHQCQKCVISNGKIHASNAKGDLLNLQLEDIIECKLAPKQRYLERSIKLKTREKDIFIFMSYPPSPYQVRYAGKEKQFLIKVINTLKNGQQCKLPKNPYVRTIMNKKQLEFYDLDADPFTNYRAWRKEKFRRFINIFKFW